MVEIVLLPTYDWGRIFTGEQVIICNLLRNGLLKSDHQCKVSGFDWLKRDSQLPDNTNLWVMLNDRTQIDYALAYSHFYHNSRDVKFFGDDYFIDTLGLQPVMFGDIIQDGLNKFSDHLQDGLIFSYKGFFISKKSQVLIAKELSKRTSHLKIHDSSLAATKQGLEFLELLVNSLDKSRITFHINQTDLYKFTTWLKGNKNAKLANNRYLIIVSLNDFSLEIREQLDFILNCGFSLRINYISFTVSDVLSNYYQLGLYCDAKKIRLLYYNYFETMEYIVRENGEDTLDDLGIVLSARRSAYVPGFIPNSLLLDNFIPTPAMDTNKLLSTLNNCGVTHDLIELANSGRFEGIIHKYMEVPKHSALTSNIRAFVALARMGLINNEPPVEG